MDLREWSTYPCLSTFNLDTCEKGKLKPELAVPDILSTLLTLLAQADNDEAATTRL
jgi:hypothetical protein